MKARAAAALLLIFIFIACAPKAPLLPSGGGAPLPEFASAYAQAAEGCDGVRTLSAVMSLSGRAGTQRLRGRIDAGFDAPDRIVLEAVAPFGKPFFLLAAGGSDSLLVLPRDGRYLRGAPPAAIVEAITGVSLDPAELRMVISGCGIPSGQAIAGLSFDGGWASIDTGDTTVWLRRIDGRWRVAAATRGPISIHYADFTSSRPATVRIRVTLPDAAGADLTLRLTDVDVNVPLAAEVFTLDVPRDALPITLDELRRSGPLGRTEVVNGKW
jgi:outer membrane lipoprotein-sorting protein